MRKFSAVCVGINDYPGSGSDLSGCVNDALDWDNLLLQRGSDTALLLDTGATKGEIVQALQESLAKLTFGDRFVFSFSGHGTWVPDTDGDEIDQRDEALCCFDYSSGGLLTDDELHAIFQARRTGVRVTVLSDSCHSGTVARLMADAPDGPTRGKFLPPTMFSDLTAKEAVRIEASTENTRPRSGTVLISGCADHEYSYDASFDGRPNGAFTYFALKALQEATTVENVYERIRTALPSPQHPQTPQLNASAWQKRTWLL